MNAAPVTTVDLPVEATKTAPYRNEREVEETLRSANRCLKGLENELTEQARDLPDPPLVFIVYVPRSGSTVLSQLLARTGHFNYISNFQARFWLAPYVGGIVEKSLGPRDCSEIPLQSRHGLTETISSPSEFSYFWQHWLKFEDHQPHTLDDQQWRRVDLAGIRREIRQIGSLRSGPLFFKKEWLGMNAGYFLKAFPSLKVIHVRRDPADVARSIAAARRAVYGAVDTWWAGRPAAYAQLRELPWREQIAGQIHGILADTSRWEAAYPDRFMSIDYERLTTDVPAAFRRIGDFLNVEVPADRLPRRLALPRRSRVADDHQLQRALADWGLG